MSTTLFGPEEILTGEQQQRAVEVLLKKLTHELSPEGYTFSLGPKREEEFQRVFVRQSLEAPSPDLYLDLRVGPNSPKGRVIEMATSKPGTYGVPGFARHIMGQQELSDTTKTFADYIRSIYLHSREYNKTPQQSAWLVYQEGYSAKNYPGAGEMVEPEKERWGTPSAGAVLDPSASSGKRKYTAGIVRYSTPPELTSQYDIEKEYLRPLIEEMKTGGGPKELLGYGPNVKWSAWVPTATGKPYFTSEPGEPHPILRGHIPRTSEQAAKSLTTVHEARELANVPIYRDEEGKFLTALTSYPTKRKGVREGWTRSSMVLPEELEPRDVLAKQVALGDQPMLPGAVIASKSAFEFSPGQNLYAIGSKGNVEYRFGVKTIQQLLDLVKNKNLTFDELEGRFEGPGSGMIRLGAWDKPLKEGEAVPEPEPMLVDREGYNIRLHRPTLHIPEFYYQSIDEKGDPVSVFSNMPKAGRDNQPTRTDETVRYLREKYGKVIDVVQYSAIGSGEEGDRAEVYVTAPIDRITDVSMKTSGMKAGINQLTENLFLKYLGMENEPQKIDFFTQEGKIPSRILMSSFGIMNMKTQLSFLDEFLATDDPKNQAGVAALKSYVTSAYEEGGKKPSIFADVMAEKWNAATGQNISADQLFTNMFQKIVSIRDEKEARRIYKTYRIGIPIQQMLEANTYSATQKEDFERLIQQATAGDKTLKDMITFERIKRDPDIGKIITQSGEDPVGLQQDLYRMKFAVPGGGQSVSLMAGTSYVSEWPSKSSFINAQAIKSLMDQYPQAAYEMGLTNKPGGQYVGESLEVSENFPHTRGWKEMYRWMSFQRDIMDFDQDQVNIPGKTVAINPEDPRLAGDILDAIVQARKEATDKEQLNVLYQQLNKIRPEKYGYDENTRIGDSYILEQTSGILAPKLSSVLDIESYEKGVEAGTSVGFFGKNYINMLEAAVQSAISEPGAFYSVAADARNRFYNRMYNVFFPGGRRSKNIFRNITGQKLPGTYGGRYGGLTQLEVGDAYASDDYIRAMLSNAGFKSQGEINGLMDYLNKNADAYLPVLTQRFPDVSSKHQFIPMKLRSKGWFDRAGIPVPEAGPASNFTYFMYTGASSIQVGDFDADPAMQKVLPITDLDEISGLHTGVWHMTPALQREFDRSFSFYEDSDAARKDALEGMFGKVPISKDSPLSGSEVLDAELKNLRDYYKFRDVSSLTSRLNFVGSERYSDILNAAMLVSHFKAGMGEAYNERTLTTDIAGAVLGTQSRDAYVRSMAYESSAASYQMYLDRMDIAKNDKTQMESLLDTFGVYGLEESNGKLNYKVRIKLSEQDQERQNDASLWPGLSGARAKYPGEMLRVIMGEVARMSEFKESNAKLAWEWHDVGSEGNAAEVFKALENPKAFWGEAYYDSLKGRGMEPDRATLLSELADRGKVGFNSPFYLSMIYRAVNRAENKYPGQFNDQRLQLPWISGKMMPLSEIKQQKEFLQMDALNKMYMSGAGTMTLEQWDLLKDLGGPRIGNLVQGQYQSFLLATGGAQSLDQAQAEWLKNVRGMEKQARMFKFGTNPTIHASEIGALVNPPSKVAEEGWQAAPDVQAYESSYHIGLRALGLQHLLSGRTEEGEVGTQFVRLNTDTEFEAIEGGTAFEQAYAASRPELTHIGKVSKENVLQYTLAGTTVRGTPDFIDYDEASGKFVIIDTKSPRADPKFTYTPEYANLKAMKYRYRLQQIAYAYGLQQKAKELQDKPVEWANFMAGWGIKDVAKAAKLQNAAAAGAFDLSLQPGRIEEGGGLLLSDPIPINYGAEEKAELESAVRTGVGNIFEPENFKNLAGYVYSALKEPGGIPAGLTGYYVRSSTRPDMPMYSILKTIMSSPGVSRASGGGRFDDTEGKRIRVGEGGPEEIVVGKEGEVSIVPTSELTESRVARGEADPREGYMGARKADGEKDISPIARFGASQSSSSSAPISQNDPEGSEWLRRQRELSGLEGMNEALNNTLQGFTDFMDRFEGGLKSLYEKGEIRLKVGGGGQEANMMRMHRQFETAVSVYGALQPELEAYQQKFQGVMISAFERAGQGDLVKSMKGTPTANRLLQLAQIVDLPTDYLEDLKREGLLEQAPMISKLGRQMESLDIISKKGVVPMLARTPESRGLVEQFTAFSGEQGMVNPLITETVGAAEALLQLKQAKVPELGKYGGVSDDAIKNLLGKFNELSEATDGLTKAHKEGKDVKEQELVVAKKKVELDAAQARIEGERFASEAGGIFQGRKPIPMAEIDKMLGEGRITSTQALAAGRASEMFAREQELMTKGVQLEETADEKSMRSIGMLARRMLGGFGLMYLRSIGGIALGPSMMGYEQGITQMAGAEQVLGARLGGYAPMGTPETRMQHIETLYGGLGYRALRDVTANIYEKQPGLAFLGGLGQAGLGGFSLAAFTAGMLNAPASTAIPLSLAIGGATAIGAGALQAYGAYQNPMQSAVQFNAIYGQGVERSWFNRAMNPAAIASSMEVATGRAEEPFSQWYYVNMLQNMQKYDVLYSSGQVNREETLGKFLEGQTTTGFAAERRRIEEEGRRVGTGRPLTSSERDQLMTMYAMQLGTQYNVAPEASYQAVSMREQYQIPLSSEKGGGLERLAVLLQQGYPVEQLAMASAYTPFRTYTQQEQAAGKIMQQWTQEEFNQSRVAKIQTGAELYASFGAIAPEYGTLEYLERGRRAVTTPDVYVSPARGISGEAGVPLAGEQVKIPGEVVWEEYSRQVVKDLTEAYKEELGNLPTATKEALARRGQVELERYGMGLPYEVPGIEMARQYAEMSPDQLQAQQRLDLFENRINKVLGTIEDNFQAIGEALPDMAPYLQMAQQPGGMLALQQVAYQQQVGMNISRQAVIGGMGVQEASQLAEMFAIMSPQDARKYQGLFEYDRNKWFQAVQQNPMLGTAMMAGATIEGAGGQQVPLTALGHVGITPVSSNVPGGATLASGQPAGVLTGLPWGRTSLATSYASSQQMAQTIFGAPGTWQGQGYDVGLINALIGGGTRGGEAYQLNLGYQNQLAQFGIQRQQLQLQQWYMPQQFQQQKQGQQINWAQQEWGLQMQERQLALSREYFGATTGLQQQQMTMQRGWQMQDWATQERTRAMQWGWRQEDYQESVRFMTGRERRLAERQFGRETIMHDIEGEQFDKQKKRQKELWALEDERFQLQVEHQEALFALQEENIEKQREFFEQRKGLEEEQFELSQEYWERSMALQEEALGVNEAYAAQMHAVSETMLTLNNYTEDVNGQLSLLNESGFKDLFRILSEIDPVFAGYLDKLRQEKALKDSMGGTYTPPANSSGNANRQHGGPVSAGLVYEVGEAGPELFKPNTDGTIIPIKDPWGASIVTPGLPQNQQSQTIHLVVQVGDERLLDKILDMVDQEVRR